MSMDFINKKNAFTLSEVLLTLALIGTLATMTLSTVGASIQQRTRLAEFRTAYAKMDAAIRSITADESKIYACYKTPSDDDISDFDLSIEGTVSEISNECEEFMNAFARAMGAARFCEGSPIADGCIPENYTKADGFSNYSSGWAYVLDNSMLIFDDGSNYLKLFAVDVNGRKGPNKWGQDIFPFSVKATESKLVHSNTFVTAVGILPADVDQSNYDKTTLEMMKESAGISD